MAGGEEFPPLLPAGLQKMTLTELKTLVVDKFTYSQSRPALWSNFMEIIDKLIDEKIPCDIWVDGSSLTEKINPDDVDFVVELPIALLSTFNQTQISLIEHLGTQAFKQGKKLHSFVKLTAPAGHPFHSKATISHNQWLKDFGYSYVKKEPKGIAVVEVRP